MTKSKNNARSMVIGPLHILNEADVKEVRKSLLKWYNLNKRVLPWRTIAASEEDNSKRAYAVWVSEIMLQQTQVATVIKFFNNWMTNWPTVQSLALASLEEINQTWAGLGYYSRAKRLQEGALKVSNCLKGEFPADRESLQKELPGVGRYTASAIASISMKQPVGVVDGNVFRVLARLLAIGRDISSQAVIEEFWKLADQLVDREQPGDFNQAIMELGATVCTPKTPSCSTCPLKKRCVAYAVSESKLRSQSVASSLDGKTSRELAKDLADIECVPNCDLCLKKSEWEDGLGVQNFPRKGKKTLVRRKTSAVVIVRSGRDDSERYLVVQRPKGGLLANLWEFLNVSLFEENAEEDKETMQSETRTERSIMKMIKTKLKQDFGLNETLTKQLLFVNDVIHVFSHIHQTYRVYGLNVEESFDVSLPHSHQGSRWMAEGEFLSCATSTAMKKVLKAYKSHRNGKSLKRGPPTSASSLDQKQPKLSHFFKPIPRE